MISRKNTQQNKKWKTKKILRLWGNYTVHLHLFGRECSESWRLWELNYMAHPESRIQGSPWTFSYSHLGVAKSKELLGHFTPPFGVLPSTKSDHTSVLLTLVHPCPYISLLLNNTFLPSSGLLQNEEEGIIIAKETKREGKGWRWKGPVLNT